MERLVELVAGDAPQPAAPHAYLVPLGEQAQAAGLALAEKLRDEITGLRLHVHCGGGSLKSAMKKADRSGAAAALILGAEELASGHTVLKLLRSTDAQQVVDRETLGRHLAKSVAADRG